MTLRAYRPNQPGNDDQNSTQNGMQNDWQDTLLDRAPNSRGSSLRVSYGQPRSRIWLITGLFALAAILVTGYFVMQGRRDGNAIPLIQADTAPYKVQPAQPGGAEIPFQDKLVFNRLDPNGQPVQAEKLLPPPEEPMASANATNNPQPVQQPTQSSVQSSSEPLTSVTTAVAPAPIATPAPIVAAAPIQQPVTPVAIAPTPAVNPKTATIAATPAAEEPEESVAATAPTPVAKPVPATATTTTATNTAAGGSVRIQLASIPDQANAQKALPTLSSKYASALGSAKLSLVRAEIPSKGTYWRVQSQPLDRATADRVCSAIKAQGGVCITAK